MNNEIFHYLKPHDNDMLSKMKDKDLKQLLYYLDDYYLDLRDSLNLNNKITFGLELESEYACKDNIEQSLLELPTRKPWIAKEDGTLNNGIEINSPILKDNKKTWQELKEVCNILEKHSIIDTNCGGHIHIGTQILGNNTPAWLNFIKLWSVYENVIFRFSYGDYLTGRPEINTYAPPLASTLWKDYKKLKKYDLLNMEDIIDRIFRSRHQAVNFSNVDNTNNINKIEENNTIEFRCPNGTLDPVIWQNNVNFFANLLSYSKSDQYNDDLIQKRRSINKTKYPNLNYNNIYLPQSLELSDMLFDNNIDKIYFLRQYLKSFDTSNEVLCESKQFTKKKELY